jgi:hypothetical protein
MSNENYSDLIASDNYKRFSTPTSTLYWCVCVCVCVCVFFSLQFYDVGQLTIINKNI